MTQGIIWIILIWDETYRLFMFFLPGSVKSIQTGFLVLILLLSLCLVTGVRSSEEGIVLYADDRDEIRYDTGVYVSDLNALLSLASGKDIPDSNLSLQLFRLEQGSKVSPNSILQIPEVLFIFNGTASIYADETLVTGHQGDAVYLPSNVTRMIENEYEEDLQLLSIIDWNYPGTDDSSDKTPDTTVLIESVRTVTPFELANENIGDEFLFYRLLHPSERPLMISYDLGFIKGPAGASVPDHYLDGMSQLMVITQGRGNVSVGCIGNEVQDGDIVYIAPGAVMNISAIEDLEFMMITSPFYRPEGDHLIDDACVEI